MKKKLAASCCLRSSSAHRFDFVNRQQRAAPRFKKAFRRESNDARDMLETSYSTRAAD